MADFTKPKIIIDLEEYEHLKKIEKEYNEATDADYRTNVRYSKRDMAKEADEFFRMEHKNAQP